MLALCTGLAMAGGTVDTGTATYTRDPGQAVDKVYTARIGKYTTRPDFNSPLTDYLPASSTVPTPLDVLGHIAGAPDYLPYPADIYRYFRALAKSSPRVRVFTIGRTAEGREMIAVAVADAGLLDQLDANRARLAKLADPRLISMDDAVADRLIADSTPVYYITGSTHANETGSPTALMELAYRLAVDDAPYIRQIRKHVITLITPVVDVDGRSRMVDIYNWHLAHPDRKRPPLVYWGHYVAHDINRDALCMALPETRNIADTYLRWHAQVLHDLHESRALLYDNTIGDGPYNAWLDPILVNELHALAWNNVQQMTRLGMPGVYTHGKFDTWSPAYLLFIATMHNGIGRLYETFSNHGADTLERVLPPDKYQRTWWRENPPPAKFLWSQRDNNNYTETGLLTTLHHFATHTRQYLRDFYLKSKRSIRKPQLAGPAAYVFPAGDRRHGSQARLLRVLQRQHVEISRTTSAVTLPAKKTADTTRKRTFAAGSYVVRMDQPYSRIADALLDRQYWSPDDPHRHPYDDTGWSLGDLFDVQVVRVDDPGILKAPMKRLTRPVSVPEGLAGVDAPRGTLPRIAVMHTWLNTQTEGWWRLALDRLGVAYDYISTQDVARIQDLRKEYDVIVFAPVGNAGIHPLRSLPVTTRQIIDGLPMFGGPLPWQTTASTPHLGHIDATADMRPGLGSRGVENLKRFVSRGGLLITSQDTARFAIDVGLAPGVFVAPTDKLRVVGSVLQARFVDSGSPIAAGYAGSGLAIYSARGLAFTVSDSTRGSAGLSDAAGFKRATGRGGPEERDIPQGRPHVAPPALPQAEPWQALPLGADHRHNNYWMIPQNLRPDVILRFADRKHLLLSGLLEHGEEIAGRPAVVLAHYGTGHVLLFANNPMWRSETIGSYALVLNAMTHYGKPGDTGGQ